MSLNEELEKQRFTAWAHIKGLTDEQISAKADEAQRSFEFNTYAGIATTAVLSAMTATAYLTGLVIDPVEGDPYRYAANRSITEFLAFMTPLVALGFGGLIFAADCRRWHFKNRRIAGLGTHLARIFAKPSKEAV